MTASVYIYGDGDHPHLLRPLDQLPGVAMNFEISRGKLFHGVDVHVLPGAKPIDDAHT